MNLCEIGKMIREERIKQGITEQELADMTGSTRRAIIYWEQGKRIPTLVYADKVLKALKKQLVLGVEEVVNK